MPPPEELDPLPDPEPELELLPPRLPEPEFEELLDRDVDVLLEDATGHFS
ncbi:hypothetical protein AB3N62_02940 [Leptospira sp. WS4.C2]